MTLSLRETQRCVVLSLVSLGLLEVSGAHALAQQEGAAAHHEHHSHKNEAALLLTSTYEAEEDQHLFTVGGEYVREIAPCVRFAATMEYLGGPGAWVFAFPVGFNLWKGLWVGAGPGLEGVSRRGVLEEELEHAGANETALQSAVERVEGRKRFFLMRVEASYNYSLGTRYSIKAGVALDWVDVPSGTATAFVYGIGLGVGF